MQIRPATVSDLAEVVACADLAFAFIARLEGNRHVKPGGNLALQIREGSIYLICDPVRVLGFISFSPNANHLFVDTIAVLPKLHGQGLGSQLLAFAEKEALRLRLRSVRLFTDGNVANNHIFYRRRGYHETGGYHEGSFSRVFYRKDVAPRACPRSGPLMSAQVPVTGPR